VDSRVARSQASLNLLACLDILTSAQDNIPGCFEQPLLKQTQQTAEAQAGEFQVVSRFDNFGGGWGYSGHSVEAIRFSADTDIVICGFGMFGGRGEYSCKLKLFDLGGANLDVAVTPVADSPAHASTSSLLTALTGTARPSPWTPPTMSCGFSMELHANCAATMSWPVTSTKATW